MTYIRRKLTCEDTIVAEARGKLREKDFAAVIDLMSHAIRTRLQHADFYWLRGLAKWQQGKVWDDPQWYQSALEDLRDSIDLDPSPIVEASEYARELLPQHWWALSAYKKILEGSQGWESKQRVAFALERIGVQTPGFVEALLTAVRCTIDKGMPPDIACGMFSKALVVMGWSRDWPYSTDAGRVVITTECYAPYVYTDDETASHRLEIDHATNWLDDQSLFDGDDMWYARDDTIREHAILPDAELKNRLSVTAPLHRAVTLSILAARGAITPTESLNAVSDRHRCVRAVAIRAIGLLLPKTDSSVALDSKMACSLIDKGLKDKSYLCRKAALETIDEWAKSIKNTPIALEHLWDRCKDAVSLALGESQRHVVIAAIRTLSTFGQFASNLIDRVEATTVATYKNGEIDMNAQLDIARCVFALSTRARDLSRRQHWQTVHSLVSSGGYYIRPQAIATVQFLTKIDPSLRDEIRPLLRERSWMDDSKAVRDAAVLALKSME